MTRGSKLFCLLLVLGTISCAVFWKIPVNKYEWMRTDPVVGTPSTRLPIDQDSWMPLTLFAIPVVVISILNSANAILRLRGRAKVLALAFSLLMLVEVAAKFCTL